MKKTKKTIADIINIAAKTKSVHDYLDYRTITPSELEKLKKYTGLDLDVQCHTVITDDIRHAYNKHKKDDLPINYEDFNLIKTIIEEYDTVECGRISKQTCNQTIVYKKVIGDKYIIVEEIRTGRKKLVFKTMYKKKIKKE